MDNGTDDGSDPAHDRVRRDLAHLGTDEASAPDVPAEVTARIGAALHAAGPAHSIRRPRLRRLHLVGLVLGLGAALTGAVVGATMLSRGPSSTLSRGPTADQIIVSSSSAGIPLSDSQILGLLTRTADYGPLADPQRRASCLDGLGYSAATKVLGAVPLDMGGKPAVMMLLPGDTPQAVVAKVVEPTCNAAHTALLADTEVNRP